MRETPEEIIIDALDTYMIFIMNGGDEGTNSR
jgi:hypothetical protein